MSNVGREYLGVRTISLPTTPVPGLFGSKRLLALAGDERLVEQIRRCNEAAFEVAFERHGPGILTFCRHMLGSREEAEDAVQQVFAAAYRDLRRGGERQINLKPWLYTIARNQCLSVLRARREHAAGPQEIATAGLAEQVERRAELRELVGDLRDLPGEQRAALLLTEAGDLSHADVAGVLGCEVARVKALVFRARTGLIERRSAREAPCNEIREQLANLKGGALRRSELRHHLRSCAGCSEYRSRVARQRQMLAVALPVALSLELKASLLAAIGGGGGPAGGAAAAGGGSVGGAAAAGGGSAGGAAVAGGSSVGGAAAVGGGAAAAGGGVAAAGAGGLGMAATASFGGTTLAKVAIVATLAGGGAAAGRAALDRPMRAQTGEGHPSVVAPTHATMGSAQVGAGVGTGDLDGPEGLVGAGTEEPLTGPGLEPGSASMEQPLEAAVPVQAAMPAVESAIEAPPIDPPIPDVGEEPQVELTPPSDEDARPPDLLPETELPPEPETDGQLVLQVGGAAPPSETEVTPVSEAEVPVSDSDASLVPDTEPAPASETELAAP